ncbi:hypothetical protein GCM10009825_34780 [Arthrobacter humicola]|uniref:Uncharacterized protein n=1 Tax=Arthrobacter humicola TaxID=409291 RepID=A0ABN2ZL23_9MICC
MTIKLNTAALRHAKRLWTACRRGRYKQEDSGFILEQGNCATRPTADRIANLARVPLAPPWTTGARDCAGRRPG